MRRWQAHYATSGYLFVEQLLGGKAFYSIGADPRAPVLGDLCGRETTQGRLVKEFSIMRAKRLRACAPPAQCHKNSSVYENLLNSLLEPLGMVGKELEISNLCAPTWGIPGRGLSFCNKAPTQINDTNYYFLLILQDQFWTGLGDIDTD